MPLIEAGPIQIYFERAGVGPRLLFISGTGMDLRVRPNVLDSPLVQHFDVLTYDQRGLGQTSKPAGPYTMADYADDAAALLEALGWDRVPVLGVSFGGMVAQELVLRHPQRVSMLVLACTSAGGPGRSSFPLHDLEALPEDERRVRRLEISDVRRDAAWREAHPDRWARLLEIAQAREPAHRDPRGASLQLAARARHDTWDRLPQIGVPVFVAGGRFDGIAPPDNLRSLARRIPHAQLRFFDGGHLFLLQDRSAYPAIIQWLESQLEASKLEE